ncbi:MAG TPA: hypothetical protein VG796_19220 [Verrucomicrobiales bacterium]|nr:hypothetical protein [Verrucomicrobiales bacterium]
MALDTYFRGNSQELEFCKKAGAGGNHLAAVTASGRRLAEKKELKLRSAELTPVLAEFKALPDAERRPPLEDPASAAPPNRPVPQPPAGGLIIRGYCAYTTKTENGKAAKATQFYYKENPDRWAAETQSDMLWLTEEEWKSFIPADAKPGSVSEVAAPIRERFFSTIGIDYMEGSVNSLPVRNSTMTLTVTESDAKGVTLRLDGYGHMGQPFAEHDRNKSNSRGCEIRLLGKIHYNANTRRIDRFDIAGTGQAWGNKMEYVRREVRLDEYPWTYGTACELVTGTSAIDRIPPYNLLHYGSAGPYFKKGK